MKKNFKWVSIIITTVLTFILSGCVSVYPEPAVTENSNPVSSQENSVTPEKSSTANAAVSESILSVCNNAVVSAEENSLRVDLSECYDTSSTDYIQHLLHDCALIIGTSNFSDYYSSLSFSYSDNNFISMLSITSFKNISDYYSSLFCTVTENGNDNYAAACSILYKELFFNHDIQNKQLIEQGKITEDSDIEPSLEDELWFYSSFSDDLIHELSGSSYVINYRHAMDDKFSYGKKVGEDINIAASNLEEYLNNNPNLLSFSNILIICFDGDSDTRLLEYCLEKSKNGSWNVSLCNFSDNNFKDGVENILN